MAHEGGRQSDSIDPASFSSLGLSDACPSRGAVTGRLGSSDIGAQLVQSKYLRIWMKHFQGYEARQLLMFSYSKVCRNPADITYLRYERRCMNQIFLRSFGGLSRTYYFRQFLFGLIYPALFWFMFRHIPEPVPFYKIATTAVFLTVNTLLYPYSRFVYETVVEFILGGNVLFVSLIPMLIVKWITMTLCWSAAIFIAPIGLLYLYVAHGRSRVDA
jgi:hypothetical protein